MTEATPPAIVLVRPTLGENIGAAARAMMNFGLSEMRLVEPKGDWPNQKAINTASGAERILEEAKIYQTTGAAVADLQRLYATTARVRDMEKPVLTPRALADALHGNSAKGEKSGILFGREAKGLHNDDVAISDAIIMVPVNSEHRSINLAQAVLLIGYEWFQQTAPEHDNLRDRLGNPPAASYRSLAASGGDQPPAARFRGLSAEDSPPPVVTTLEELEAAMEKMGVPREEPLPITREKSEPFRTR